MLPVPRWRNLPLFVSSTFRDMHAERDHLVQVVFPELEERLGARRCTLEPIDLRWGVDTAALPGEEEKERAVLRVCLDEIERSRPFQIVLIGERYGWIPPRERLEVVTAAAGLRLQELASQRAQPENIDDDREAAERGDPQAQYRLAVHLSQRQVPPDYAAAASWYEKADEQGLAEAKYNLGYLYLQGGPGIAQDAARGIEWIRAAGNQGMAIAQYDLAVFYSEGRVVQADAETAARWYRRAADQGLAAAQHNLGHLYLEGRGVGRDPAAAIEWFRKAAKQGFAPSQLALFMQGDLGAADR